MDGQTGEKDGRMNERSTTIFLEDFNQLTAETDGRKSVHRGLVQIDHRFEGQRNSKETINLLIHFLGRLLMADLPMMKIRRIYTEVLDK